MGRLAERRSLASGKQWHLVTLTDARGHLPACLVLGARLDLNAGFGRLRLCPSGGLPGFRVLSRVSPATPSAMNRSYHRHTTGLALPDRRMIAAAPQIRELLRGHPKNETRRQHGQAGVPMIATKPYCRS